MPAASSARRHSGCRCQCRPAPFEIGATPAIDDAIEAEISNFTIKHVDASPFTIGIGRQGSAPNDKQVIANMIIDGKGATTELEDGILFENVVNCGIVNNTIAYCDRGLTIESVQGESSAFAGPGTPPNRYRRSAVENNIVYEYGDYGIAIGNVSSTQASEDAADYWSPTGPDERTEVPVRNNLSWSSLGSDEHTGDTWYRDGYGVAGAREWGELNLDPVFGNPAAGVFKLQSPSPALKSGNPFRLDVIMNGGVWKGGARSLGALPSSFLSDYPLTISGEE